MNVKEYNQTLVYHTTIRSINGGVIFDNIPDNLFVPYSFIRTSDLQYRVKFIKNIEYDK